MRIVDWLARTAMLVLAAMATLALIGSLASVSDMPMAASFPGQVADVDSVDGPPPPDTEASPEPTSVPAEATQVEQRQAETTQRLRTAAEQSRDLARWLKALTYAVIALVAVAAAGVIALVRIGGHVARVAER